MIFSTLCPQALAFVTFNFSFYFCTLSLAYEWERTRTNCTTICSTLFYAYFTNSFNIFHSWLQSRNCSNCFQNVVKIYFLSKLTCDQLELLFDFYEYNKDIITDHLYLCTLQVFLLARITFPKFRFSNSPTQLPKDMQCKQQLPLLSHSNHYSWQ